MTRYLPTTCEDLSAQEEGHRRDVIIDARMGRAYVRSLRNDVTELATALAASRRPHHVQWLLGGVWRLTLNIPHPKAAAAMETALGTPVDPDRALPALCALAEALGWEMSETGAVSTSVEAEAELIYRRTFVDEGRGGDALKAFARRVARELARESLGASDGGGSRG